ncbi:MAG: hypothetical protein KJO85_03400, partial [Gammaproteobacteria bacterium]|nr:hypothetical protein [Gammaproteobacteria bacterium]
GLTLGQADVSNQGVAHGNGDTDSESAAAGVAADEIAGLGDESDPAERHKTLVSNGLVDTFA